MFYIEDEVRALRAGLSTILTVLRGIDKRLPVDENFEIMQLRKLAWEGWERAVEAEDWEREMREALILSKWIAGGGGEE